MHYRSNYIFYLKKGKLHPKLEFFCNCPAFFGWSREWTEVYLSSSRDKNAALVSLQWRWFFSGLFLTCRVLGHWRFALRFADRINILLWFCAAYKLLVKQHVASRYESICRQPFVKHNSWRSRIRVWALWPPHQRLGGKKPTRICLCRIRRLSWRRGCNKGFGWQVSANCFKI